MPVGAESEREKSEKRREHLEAPAMRAGGRGARRLGSRGVTSDDWGGGRRGGRDYRDNRDNRDEREKREGRGIAGGSGRQMRGGG